MRLIEIYTDGASHGNPGFSGAGVYIKAQGKEHRYAFPLDIMSNHEAEFHAVIKALEICQSDFPGEILSFRTDSQVVVDAIEKNDIKNKHLAPLLNLIQTLASEFPYFFIKWIPSHQNQQADQLARQALRQVLNKAKLK